MIKCKMEGKIVLIESRFSWFNVVIKISKIPSESSILCIWVCGMSSKKNKLNSNYVYCSYEMAWQKREEGEGGGVIWVRINTGDRMRCIWCE